MMHAAPTARLLRTLSLCTALLIAPVAISAQETESPPAEKIISFVAVGDTGAETPWYSFIGTWPGIRDQFWAPGKSGLTETTAMLRTYCQQNTCDFGVMLGDNIYPDGVSGEDTEEDNAKFEQIFTVPFSPLMEDNPAFRIYPTLGNHDWRGKRKGVASQVNFLSTTKPFAMKGLFYSVKPENADGAVEIFVIDTQILLTGLKVYKANLKDDGSENRDTDDIQEAKEHIKPQSTAEENMLSWLSEALKNSTAKWKFVIGHHPLWSSGGNKFEQSHALRPLLLPILCRYADGYIAGHEHTFEVQEDSCTTAFEGEAEPPTPRAPLLHIVSGAFSKSRLVNASFKDKQEERYSKQLTTHFARGKTTASEPNPYTQIWGFAHISLQGDNATVRIMTMLEDSEGEPASEPAFECIFSKGRSTNKNRCVQ